MIYIRKTQKLLFMLRLLKVVLRHYKASKQCMVSYTIITLLGPNASKMRENIQAVTRLEKFVSRSKKLSV